MSEHLYVAPELYTWKTNLEARGHGVSSPVSSPDGTKAPGFLLWFDDYETFKAEYPNKEPIVVQRGAA